MPILVEDLEDLGNRERFPQAARILDSFDPRDWQGIPLDERSYVVIVTRDHQVDQGLLEALLPYDLAYLGMIGSQRKVKVFRQRLINKGPARRALGSRLCPYRARHRRRYAGRDRRFDRC